MGDPAKMGTRVYAYMTNPSLTATTPPNPHTKQQPINLSPILSFKDSVEGQMAAANTSFCIPRESSLLAAPEFITGAGAVMVHRKSRRVVLVIDERETQKVLGWFLPKGRRDVGETFEQTAVREGEEEGGYPCRLLPLPVKTKQPRKTTGSTLSTEPIYMHNWAIPAERRFPNGGIYTCFWYVCEIDDEDVTRIEREKERRNKAAENLASASKEGTVFMDYHELRYKSELVDYEEAKRRIAASIDSTVFGTVLATAVDLVGQLDEMEKEKSGR
ncbi:hypothetical protein Dda_6381 [Drechslerella dactyloides]|uniref:Nudix hydrolase domain-containing protein n=1 Tax=Drechslerella dactyloides TaxID=74499 RepID=A0AAD6NG62_DREDA|nr:hypothetical protein Dda_6381 [Drechslerella dactyloides]